MAEKSNRPDYAALGLAALKRVRVKIARDALLHGYKVPFWENGRIVYCIPQVESDDEISWHAADQSENSAQD